MKIELRKSPVDHVWRAWTWLPNTRFAPLKSGEIPGFVNVCIAAHHRRNECFKAAQKVIEHA